MLNGYPEIKVKCVVVGDGGAGKTCLLSTYVTGHFPPAYVPTVFDNLDATVFVEGRPVRLSLWDSAGQEDYDRLRPLSYPETDIFIVCFSVGHRATFDNVLVKWAPEVTAHVPEAQRVLVGTKADLRYDRRFVEHARLHGDQLVARQEAEAMAHRIGAAAYVECSALTRSNVDQVFLEGIMSAVKSSSTLTLTGRRGSGGGHRRLQRRRKRHCAVQ